MNAPANFFLALSRISVGGLMLNSGLEKVLDPNWSALEYLQKAKTFPELYAWFAAPANIGWVNFINEWGILLLGVSLILGIGVRLSAFLGGILMLSYYFSKLDFPKTELGYIVDYNLILGFLLFYFAVIRAGRTFGIDSFWAKNRSHKYRMFKKLFG